MENEIPYPVLVEFGQSWGQDGMYAIECGVWNFTSLSELIDYYGMKDIAIKDFDVFFDGSGLPPSRLYEGNVTKNLEDHNFKY